LEQLRNTLGMGFPSLICWTKEELVKEISTLFIHQMNSLPRMWIRPQSLQRFVRTLRAGVFLAQAKAFARLPYIGVEIPREMPCQFAWYRPGWPKRQAERDQELGNFLQVRKRDGAMKSSCFPSIDLVGDTSLAEFWRVGYDSSVLGPQCHEVESPSPRDLHRKWQRDQACIDFVPYPSRPPIVSLWKTERTSDSQKLLPFRIPCIWVSLYRIENTQASQIHTLLSVAYIHGKLWISLQPRP